MVTTPLLEDLHHERANVAEWIKILLYKKQADIFDRIDFNHETAFQEPLLFSYFNQEQAHIPLEQILWGYAKPSTRWKTLPAWTESNGIIYLPNYGYLSAPTAAGAYQKIHWDGNVWRNEQNEILVKEERSVDLPSGIEILAHPLRDWENYFQHHHEVKPVEIESAFQNHREQLIAALRFLEKNYPLYYRAVQLTVRKFVLFGGAPNSFATVLAHGTGFLNPTEQDGLVFFLDNIVHQCGHVIYTTLTFEKEEMFTVDPDSNMMQWSGAEEDSHISLYGRYHGLFTQTSVNNLWSICVDQQLCEGRDAHEILGRFATYMHRFSKAVKKFEATEHILASEGQRWFNHFRSEYHRLQDKHRELLAPFDTSQQPYVFDYQLFRQFNPPQQSLSTIG